MGLTNNAETEKRQASVRFHKALRFVLTGWFSTVICYRLCKSRTYLNFQDHCGPNYMEFYDGEILFRPIFQFNEPYDHTNFKNILMEFQLLKSGKNLQTKILFTLSRSFTLHASKAKRSLQSIKKYSMGYTLVFVKLFQHVIFHLEGGSLGTVVSLDGDRNMTYSINIVMF